MLQKQYKKSPRLCSDGSFPSHFEVFQKNCNPFHTSCKLIAVGIACAFFVKNILAIHLYLSYQSAKIFKLPSLNGPGCSVRLYDQVNSIFFKSEEGLTIFQFMPLFATF